MKQSVTFILICKQFKIPKDIARIILDFADYKILNFIVKYDCITIKNKNGTRIENEWFDPGDDIMFFPLETKGYKKEYHDSLDLDERCHNWYGDSERMKVHWKLHDSWPSSFKNKITLKLLRYIQWQFENSPIVIINRLTK